jgi:L-rhamnose mutarotase
MRDQLKPHRRFFKPQTNQRSSRDQQQYFYPDVNRRGEDGFDHINVWDGAETDLGRFICHNNVVPFRHNIFGSFNTMTGFWRYIQSAERDDRLREMSGGALKRFANQLTREQIQNFKAIIGDTIWQKFKAKERENQRKAMKNSTLPFECYYVNKETGMRERPTFFGWLLPLYEEIRRAIKEDREPNFTPFLDVKDSGIYDFVLTEEMKERMEKIKAEKKEQQEKKQQPKQHSFKNRQGNKATQINDELTHAPDVENAKEPETSEQLIVVNEDQYREALETLANSIPEQVPGENTCSSNNDQSSSTPNIGRGLLNSPLRVMTEQQHSEEHEQLATGSTDTIITTPPSADALNDLMSKFNKN